MADIPMGHPGWKRLGCVLFWLRGAGRSTAAGCGLSLKAPARARQVVPYDIVRIVLGSLLLVAAGLKAHELATEPLLASALLHSRWFLVAVVQFELLLGLCLCLGLWPQHTRNLGLLCFAVFACISLYKGFTEASSELCQRSACRRAKHGCPRDLRPTTTGSAKPRE